MPWVEPVVLSGRLVRLEPLEERHAPGLFTAARTPEVWRLLVARNMQSRRAIERIGAKEEGILRRHMVAADGVLRDSVYFSVIAEEWPAVKERLEELMR